MRVTEKWRYQFEGTLLRQGTLHLHYYASIYCLCDTYAAETQFRRPSFAKVGLVILGPSVWSSCFGLARPLKVAQGNLGFHSSFNADLANRVALSLLFETFIC